MFALIRILSAVIGALVIVQVALLALVVAFIATPITLVLGIIGGVVVGLGGALGGERVENSTIRKVSDFSWAPGRWAFDVVSVLKNRFAKFLGSNPNNQEDSSFTDAIVRDWPAWSWYLIIGEMSQGRHAHVRKVGVFPSKEAAENALREDRLQHGERRNLAADKDSFLGREFEETVKRIEAVKRTSANIMLAVVVIADTILIILLSI